jgi:hypothetical protein
MYNFISFLFLVCYSMQIATLETESKLITKSRGV